MSFEHTTFEEETREHLKEFEELAEEDHQSAMMEIQEGIRMLIDEQATAAAERNRARNTVTGSQQIVDIQDQE